MPIQIQLQSFGHILRCVSVPGGSNFQLFGIGRACPNPIFIRHMVTDLSGGEIHASDEVTRMVTAVIVQFAEPCLIRFQNHKVEEEKVAMVVEFIEGVVAIGYLPDGAFYGEQSHERYSDISDR